MSTTSQSTRPLPALEDRVERLLRREGVRLGPATAAGIIGTTWLPDAALNDALGGLAELRARLATAREREQVAIDRFTAAKRRRDEVERLRQDAARADIAVELPSPSDAQQAIDDALLRVDAAREQRSAAIVEVFMAARGHAEAWRSAAEPAFAGAAERERVLLEQLATARVQKRAHGALLGLVEDLDAGEQIVPWRVRVERAERAEHEPQPPHGTVFAPGWREPEEPVEELQEPVAPVEVGATVDPDTAPDAMDNDNNENGA